MDFNEFSSIFDTVMGDNGFSRFCGAPFAERFYRLTERMLEVNKTMNLTAIKEPRAVVLRHYADSLTVEPLLPQNASVVDVGCGAGFPSLPLAVCRSDLRITALDSTEKRIRYVRDAAALLGCKHFTAVAARAEEAGKERLREQFDVCVARAVAALPVLAELCLPFVKVGGKFLAMKSRRGEEEWESAAEVVARLGGELATRHAIVLTGDGEQEERVIFEIGKVKPTPVQYPRAYAKIAGGVHGRTK